MFGDSGSLFDNVPDSFRPDRAGPPSLPPSQAHTPAAPPGMHGTPDGIGGPLPEGLPMQYATGVPPGGGVPMGGAIAPYEPRDVSPEAAIRSAGITTLATVVAFGAGLALGGWKGGMAGLLLTGGAFNVYRAQKWWGSADASEKHEAVTSAVMGAAGVVGGGYTAYKAYQAVAEED